MAKPPRKWPTMAIEKRMIRLATPPVDIKLEARIKNGIANKVYFCDAVNNCKATEETESGDKKAMTNTLDKPNDTATGTPKNKKRNNNKNKVRVTTAILQQYFYFFLIILRPHGRQ